LPSVRKIRWQAPSIWPSVEAFVPDGRQVITSRADADAYFATIIALTAEHWRQPYTRLWHAALDFGYQPNGLLVANLTRLAPDIAFHAQQFGRDCLRNGIWTYVPGKLHPSFPHPGRYRCYLITKPEDNS
jgi:hypothetical protein